MSEVELNEPSAGGYSVTLPTFEGPLDLLLHLCQKHELDILDIPIAFVTEKYLEYLAVMQLMNLDVASEYLVMAATLAHIKSKMLLPAPPPGQEDELAAEEEDPREALIRRLLAYQKYKLAGEELNSLGVAQQNVFLRGMPIEEAVHTGLPPLAQVPLFSLVDAFQNVLSKSKVKLSHDIVHERVTLADRINELVDVLRARRRVAFEELFEGLTTRFDLVITFLALLEMTRLRMTRLFQADFESHIYIEFTAQVTADDDNVEPAVATEPAAEVAGAPRSADEHEIVHGSAAQEEVTTNGATYTVEDETRETTELDAAGEHGAGDEPSTEAELPDLTDASDGLEMTEIDAHGPAVPDDAAELAALDAAETTELTTAAPASSEEEPAIDPVVAEPTPSASDEAADGASNTSGDESP